VSSSLCSALRAAAGSRSDSSLPFTFRPLSRLTLSEWKSASRRCTACWWPCCHWAHCPYTGHSRCVHRIWCAVKCVVAQELREGSPSRFGNPATSSQVMTLIHSARAKRCQRSTTLRLPEAALSLVLALLLTVTLTLTFAELTTLASNECTEISADGCNVPGGTSAECAIRTELEVCSWTHRFALTLLNVVIASASTLSHLSTPLSMASASSLISAVEAGNLDGVKKALAAGESPDTLNAQGQAPLHIIVTQSFRKEPTFPIIEALLAAKATIDLPNAQGLTAAQVAAQSGWQDNLALLLSRGAKMNADMKSKIRLTWSDNRKGGVLFVDVSDSSLTWRKFCLSVCCLSALTAFVCWRSMKKTAGSTPPTNSRTRRTTRRKKSSCCCGDLLPRISCHAVRGLSVVLQRDSYTLMTSVFNIVPRHQ
jgi:hypothetical protein